MWQCPKCGRELKSVNQDHYCGKISTIDEYILAQTEEAKPLLYKIRETIRSVVAPDAIEKISWQMPTFWKGKSNSLCGGEKAYWHLPRQ